MFCSSSVEWSPHLCLQVMAKYGVLFQYLLRLKRIAAELDETWAVMRRQALRGRGLADHERRLPLWHLRHHMAYMVANLQIYLQVGRTQRGSLHRYLSRPRLP